MGDINTDLGHLIYLARLRSDRANYVLGVLNIFIQPNKWPQMFLNLFIYARKMYKSYILSQIIITFKVLGLMEEIKNLALVAHDNRKADLIEWVGRNYESIMHHKWICTGTTGALIEESLKKNCLRKRSLIYLKRSQN